jgi:hypothetical protein
MFLVHLFVNVLECLQTPFLVNYVQHVQLGLVLFVDLGRGEFVDDLDYLKWEACQTRELEHRQVSILGAFLRRSRWDDQFGVLKNSKHNLASVGQAELCDCLG